MNILEFFGLDRFFKTAKVFSFEAKCASIENKLAKFEEGRDACQSEFWGYTLYLDNYTTIEEEDIPNLEKHFSNTKKCKIAIVAKEVSIKFY
jgi:hypothetical protein